ncbi:nitrogenase component 1 [Clostridium cylindrosporum]|uniref:Oxidoreductase/nitrogenase component 1 n=1 Tax=Clostridium cylindrosporum DSM 605 TaxID=1121307 RepID=A0A0J8D9I7_CLOCY|nr:nitrogenase component 1 [Clostridium cylindrosporum]KMT20963.1 oxidoreductase/nitrogenase component 1 [Clostridium cylindrosporum DSM 605]
MTYVESPRNGCFFQGVIETLSTIEGVIPIVHSTKGCSIQSYLSGREFQGGDKIHALEIPSSNITEKHVVFGGTSRLREQIKNTLQVVDGKLYVVVTGCTPELVGDDVLYMAKESRDQGNNVIHINAPGFKGNSQSGYEIAGIELLNNFNNTNEIVEKNKNLVNIFGIVPNSDLYWRGSLESIKAILEAIGLKVNTFLGLHGGLDEWENASKAALNIVLSPWGHSIAKHLEERYNVPFIDFGYLPVGEVDTKEFILKVASELSLDTQKVKEYTDYEIKRTSYYTFSAINIYKKYSDRKRFSVVGNFSTVVGLTKFLTKEVGIIPERLIVSDIIDTSLKERLLEYLADLSIDIRENIYFSDNLGQIQDILGGSNTEIIFGSSLEKNVSEELFSPLVIVSTPSLEEIFLSKSYTGFNGGISLLEDLINKVYVTENKVRLKAEEGIRKLVSQF